MIKIKEGRLTITYLSNLIPPRAMRGFCFTTRKYWHIFWHM